MRAGDGIGEELSPEGVLAEGLGGTRGGTKGWRPGSFRRAGSGGRPRGDRLGGDSGIPVSGPRGAGAAPPRFPILENPRKFLRIIENLRKS